MGRDPVIQAPHRVCQFVYMATEAEQSHYPPFFFRLIDNLRYIFPSKACSSGLKVRKHEGPGYSADRTIPEESSWCNELALAHLWMQCRFLTGKSGQMPSPTTACITQWAGAGWQQRMISGHSVWLTSKPAHAGCCRSGVTGNSRGCMRLIALQYARTLPSAPSPGAAAPSSSSTPTRALLRLSCPPPPSRPPALSAGSRTLCLPA